MAASLEERLMARALAEAEKGRGRTSPNPIVGAVVARGSRVVGVGHHMRAGTPHAEVHALRAAGERARGADLYVTLEPCNHFGRTPPCTEAILAAGVRRVFVGSRDPNPGGKGRGAERLRRAGVEVRTGISRAECDAASEQWRKFITTGLPWVVLKAAVTLAGKLAAASGDSKWISSEASRALVHRWRDELDAVLVGVQTVLADDPRLTARVLGARDPLRVIVDSRLRTPPRAKCLPAVVAHTLARPRTLPGAELLSCKKTRQSRVDLRDLLRKLAKRGVVSVLVEGGAQIHGSLLRAGLWDELRLFVAPKVLGEGARSWAGFRAPARMTAALAVEGLSAAAVGADILLTARRPQGRV